MIINWSDMPAPNGLPTALQQAPAYGNALRGMGLAPLTATLTSGNALLASAQIIPRRFGPLGHVALLPRGPVWQGMPTPDQRAEALRLIARTLPLRGLRALITNAESGADTPLFRQRGDIALVTPQHVAEIDLTQPRSLRRAALAQKWRNRLSHSETAGPTVTHRPFPADPAHWLLRAEAAQRHARKYRALPDQFTLSFARTHPDKTRLFTALQHGTPVAAMLFLLHAPVATYHIGWSGEAGRTTSAHNLLLWQASNWLADRGFRRLDLGTVDTETAPGLARFKIGAGAAIRGLGPTWAYAPGASSLLRHLANRAKSPISDETPPISAHPA